MRVSQMYRDDSAPQEPKSTLRGVMQRLGLTLLACALAIGATGYANAKLSPSTTPRKRPLPSPE